MINRSGVTRSWCNISLGLTKVLAVMCGSVTTVGSTNFSKTDVAADASGKDTIIARPQLLSEEVAGHLCGNGNVKKEAVYRAVPSTRTGRAAGFASLFLQLGWDRLVGSREEGGEGKGGLFSQHSHQRIVETLCRMRGSVLKLGQMLSIQDDITVPSHITQLFARVRDSAYAMPHAQLVRTLEKEFRNANWREDLFVHFLDEPIASASIGQVHRAAVQGSDEATVEEVAVKVQYPGVAQSIDSDVANLKMLMSFNILPPGMFVDNILQELRQELTMECNYTLEAAKQMRYTALVQHHPLLHEVFVVPKVYKSLSTDRVLVTQLVSGVPIDQLATLSGEQDLKNYVAHRMMLLTLTELFCWRFMQTDPNFSNFLFNASTNKIHLLDFGAAREYSVEFVDEYLEVFAAAAREDRDTIIKKSINLGFLTGDETGEMLDAHVTSVMLLGKPFRNRDTPFDFGKDHLPSQIQSYVPTMIRLRLRPPPTPVYSLHRRLSGVVLLATKLKANIHAGDIFWDIYAKSKAL